MDYRLVFEISAAGMNLEKRRVDVAALNLANMHATAPAGQPAYRPQRITAQALNVDFSQIMTAVRSGELAAERQLAVVQLELPPRLAHDPGHPHADAKGFVSYPAVDHAGEMLSVMTAMRAYEANVTVAASAKAMAARALEIGSQS